MERLGRYDLLRRIAIGGMAEIYIARETGLAGFQRPVVVKRVLPALGQDEGFVELFLDEARLAARLTHPKVVHIYELGHVEDSYFIAMEFVPGCDLDSLLAAAPGPVPLGETLHVISEVLEGLHYAHSLADPHGVPLGVVHRDIAPKNVLISLDGAVKIVDFGIAKARTKATVTAPGLIMGTYACMSPEQANGRPVDRRADVFAAGAMLYRMVTGLNAYRSEGMRLVEEVRTASFRRPCLENPDLPSAVEGIVLQAMRVDVDERYPTAAHMRRDVLAAVRELGLDADSESLAALVRQRLPHLEALVGRWLSDQPSPADPEPEQEAASERERPSVAERLRALGAGAECPKVQGQPAWAPVEEYPGQADPDAPTAAVDLPERVASDPVDGGDDEDSRETWPSDVDDEYGLDEPATLMEAPRFPGAPTLEAGDVVDSLDLRPGDEEDLVGLDLPADVEQELRGQDPATDLEDDPVELEEAVTTVAPTPSRGGTDPRDA